MSPQQVGGLIVYGMFIGVALGAPIGPINVEIVVRGIRFGFRSGWLVGLGALSVDTIFASLIVSGLAPVTDSPKMTVPLFLAGSIMLGYVGVSSIRRALKPADALAGQTATGSRSYLAGAAIAALSPMGIVYWLSVGSALVAEAVGRVGQIGAPVLVAGVFLGLFSWVTFLSILAQVARGFVTGKGLRYVTGASGIIIIGFAGWFLVQAVRAIQ